MAETIIQRLPEGLIDQIAAGEVVERPASIVKELVENAVDAGSSRIRVEVREGGRSFLAVADDGCGMSPADARLALERHATSKLRSVEDLPRIATFGFRGEALPAIASVSDFRLRTRRRDDAEAFELRLSPGQAREERAAAGAVGTRVEVAALFGSVPARRKFLKTAATEWGHVADWIARVALALPGVHFEVRRDDRPAIVWPASSDPLDRIAAVLSEADAAALVAHTGQEGDATLRAFVSRPDAHRATGAGLHLFVNGRPVRDRLLRHALLEVYRDVLPRGRFPTALLFLEMAPGAVDVNVHPAKWEVRFADPQAIHRLIRHTVRDALAARTWLGTAPSPNPNLAPMQAGLAGAQRGPVRIPLTGAERSQPQGVAERSSSDWVFAAPASAPDAPLRFSDLRVLGQLLGTYLLVESKDGLLLVDQHAAHERVLYERMRAEWLEQGVARQGLLAPLPLELDAADRAALLDGADLVARLGFEVEAFGEEAVVIRSMPALLAGLDPGPLVRGLAEELRSAGLVGGETQAGTRILDAADQLFASLACHSARRAGEVLEPREQSALLDSLDSIPWAPTCPHGRPVAVRFDLSEIEHRFARR